MGVTTKITPIDNTEVAPDDTVTLVWEDDNSGATKYAWALTYVHPIYGDSVIGGTAWPPALSKDVSSSISTIFDTGATQAYWTLRPYVGGTYLDDWQGPWLILISFPFDPPLPTGVTLDAEGNPTGTPTGENNMVTIKRIVVAANDKVFYET